MNKFLPKIKPEIQISVRWIESGDQMDFEIFQWTNDGGQCVQCPVQMNVFINYSNEFHWELELLISIGEQTGHVCGNYQLR